MYSATDGQSRVDRFVAAFSVLVATALAGMLTGIAWLVIVPIPLLALVLALLAALGPENRWPDRGSLVLLAGFHMVSVALWMTALVTMHDLTPVLGGMPLSTGLLTLVAWPWYALVAGLVYAVCAGRAGIVEDAAGTR